jgi:HSP20 family protein
MMRSPLINDLVSLRNTVDPLFRERPFGDPFNALWSRAETGGGAVARPIPLDVYATDDRVVITAAVPGIRPDDLQLTVHQNTVTLSGSLRNVADTEEGQKATWYLQELPSGSVRRSITLPFEVDAGQADASFEHGILRVVLPKAEAAKPKQITIHSGQGQAIEAGSTEQS